jgi:hypothetical protein
MGMAAGASWVTWTGQANKEQDNGAYDDVHVWIDCSLAAMLHFVHG